MLANKYILKDKLLFEWIVIGVSVLIALLIFALGVDLLIKAPEIFSKIIAVLLLLLVVGAIYLVYKFYKNDPWGWYGLLLFNGFTLLAATLIGYSSVLLSLMNSFYLRVVLGFATVIIEMFSTHAYDFQMYLSDVFFAETSFLVTHGITIGVILLLGAIYWSYIILGDTLSDLEVVSLKKKLIIFLIFGGFLLIFGLYELIVYSTTNVIFGAFLAEGGFIADLVLLSITLDVTHKNYLKTAILFSTVVVLALLVAEFQLAIAILAPAINVWLLQSTSVRNKFDVLWTFEQKEERTAITLIIPTLSAVILIVLMPVIWVVIASFFNIGLRNLGPNAPPAAFVGFQNYIKFLLDPEFYITLYTSILYTILGTVLSVSLGLMAALLINRKFPGRGVVRTIYLFPYIASTVAIIFLWKWAFHGVYGIFNYFLLQLGLIDSFKPWLDQQPWAFIILVIFEGWKYFPFAMLLILAQLQAIPEELYEAASIDGANDWDKFIHITLPELKYVLGVVFLLRFIWTFNKFDDVYLFTRGSIETGTSVIPTYIYDKVWTGTLFKVSEAAAIAVLMVIILIGFSAVFGRKVLKW